MRTIITSDLATAMAGWAFRKETLVFDAIAHLGQVYPGFEDWYWGKVLPGVSDLTRRLFTEERDGRVIAVVIAKSQNGERKLCTVWVHPEYVGRGLGVGLMRSAMSWLETDKPLISVPEERIRQFAPIFASWGFELSQVLDSHYRHSRKEYVFNGTLKNSLVS